MPCPSLGEGDISDMKKILIRSSGRRIEALSFVGGVSFFHTHCPFVLFQISKDPIFVPGVWGPYFSAMVPGFWLNEGGQSVTGKLVSLHFLQRVVNVAIPSYYITHSFSSWTVGDSQSLILSI